MALAGLLARERTVAPPEYNRWLVPPAALAVHLSIGMAYGLSVFWLPLSRAIGITASAPDDWKISTLGWMYTLFFVALGSSAAIFGAWVEREGPRKAGVVAACCWGGGFFISALGVYVHQVWLLWIGSGVIGGCGLGLGYISPVSTLIKWFPDRRGLATGLAIMGFGGGAMIGAPLADALMRRFATGTSVGVWQTFLVMGTVYSSPNAGALGATGCRHRVGGLRVDRALDGLGHANGAGRHRLEDAAILAAVGDAVPERQRWHWRARHGSPMIQEMFRGRVTASAAAGFTSLLSLFNIAGRIFWASLSDWIGRRATYAIFFALGVVLYASAPTAGARGGLALFVAIFCVILTMYGGGFATIPAYLSDLFGVGHVSAIHGRVLTAWSTAGILGPVLVNYLREGQLAAGVAPSDAYTFTMYILSGFLVVGFVCTMLIRPVSSGSFVSATPARPAAAAAGSAPLARAPRAGQGPLVAVAWLLVCLPLGWGVLKTLVLARQLFW